MPKRRFRVLIALGVGLVAGFAAAQESQLPPAPEGKRGVQPSPQLGGATTVSYYRVGAADFSPNYSSATWTREGGDERLISLDTLPTSYYGNPHLPGGALLRTIEFDSCDTNAAGKHMTFYFYSCTYLGSCNEQLAFESSANLEVECGALVVDLTPLGYVVDNNVKALAVTVQFASGDTTNKFSGAIIGYQLQVSPAPAVATFADVPVGSQYHQFVQALVASGVTAGCGSGNYCPDTAITRGQMAVFLAKALGLNWSK